jgi:arsenical-resistance protein 2
MIGQGGTIRGSINLPAHSLYPTLPAVYALLSSSGVKHVIWYCGKSSILYLVDITAYIDH